MHSIHFCSVGKCITYMIYPYSTFLCKCNISTDVQLQKISRYSTVKYEYTVYDILIYCLLRKTIYAIPFKEKATPSERHCPKSKIPKFATFSSFTWGRDFLVPVPVVLCAGLQWLELPISSHFFLTSPPICFPRCLKIRHSYVRAQLPWSTYIYSIYIYQ